MRLEGFEQECCRELKHELVLIRQVLEEILLELKPQPIAQSASLRFVDAKGVPLMPASIALNGNGALAVFTEFDGANGTGNPLPPVGAVSFSSDNPAVATVDASGNVTAVSVGTANISATDAGNSLTASDSLTVTPAIAKSATLALSAK